MKYSIEFKSLPIDNKPELSQLLQELEPNPNAILPDIGDFLSFFDFDSNDEKLWVVVSRFFRYLTDKACVIEILVDPVPE
ncbi:hypothetical protein [Phyllobacterium sp. SB3]|uniref:hypothetical protein n=1 Tax=Phyllobacterium sp. SB3 TaxID=3156073 RepID=UPI0032AFE943